jgi:hypothetical protein
MPDMSTSPGGRRSSEPLLPGERLRGRKGEQLSLSWRNHAFVGETHVLPGSCCRVVGREDSRSINFGASWGDYIFGSVSDVEYKCYWTRGRG